MEQVLDPDDDGLLEAAAVKQMKYIHIYFFFVYQTSTMYELFNVTYVYFICTTGKKFVYPCS